MNLNISKCKIDGYNSPKSTMGVCSKFDTLGQQLDPYLMDYDGFSVEVGNQFL